MFKWTTKKEQFLLEQKSKGATYAQIANKLETTFCSVRSKYRKLTKKTKSTKKKQTKGFNFDGFQARPSPIPALEVFLDDCLVASDFHVPGESEEAVKKLVNYAIKNKVKNLIIAGDFWHQDAVSRWALKDPNMPLEAELERGIKLINRLSKYMNLYFVQGNHDSRLCEALSFKLTFSAWMKTLVGDKFNKSVFVTNFDYLFLFSNNVKFRICHPKLYSRIKTSEVSKISHDKNENVIMGHQHYFSMTTNKTGEYICMDSGCMCDIRLFLYKNASTSKCPEWENGFIHVKGGKVRPVCWYTF